MEWREGAERGNVRWSNVDSKFPNWTNGDEDHGMGGKDFLLKAQRKLVLQVREEGWWTKHLADSRFFKNNRFEEGKLVLVKNKNMWSTPHGKIRKVKHFKCF